MSLLYFSFQMARRGAGSWLVVLGWALSALAWPLASHGLPLASFPTTTLAAALQPDGTLRPGATGSFDASQFAMGTAPDGSPIFRPKSQLGAGDFRWQDGFGLPQGANGVVLAMLQVGADTYVGGSFTSIGNVVANGLARWDGTAWHPVGTGVENGVSNADNGVLGQVTALALAPNGDLYVGGAFKRAGSVAAVGIARWNGVAWSSLGSGLSSGSLGSGGASALVVAPNGDLYVGGLFSYAGGVLTTNIAKWNGSTWSSLRTGSPAGVNRTVMALALSPTGDLYAGGYFTQAGTTPVEGIARWDGTAWRALGSGVRDANGLTGIVRTLVCDATGQLYAGGRFLTAGGVVANSAARWDGSAWSALGAGPTPNSGSEVYNLTLTPGGDLYAAGYRLMAGTANTGVLRWNGSSWQTLGAGATGIHSQPVMALAVTPTGDLFLGGDFEQYNGVGATRLARWDGSIWRPFTSGPGNGLNDRSTAVAVAPNGNVYVAGWFYRAGGQPLYNLACWNGSSWSSLGLGPGSGINGSISALAVAPNGDVYIGGNFSQVGTVPANGVARWNGSTWSALSSSTGNGVSGWVRAMAVTPTGELYVGGQFGSAGGRTANAVAHWNGTAWDNMSGGIPNSNQSPTTWAMALAPNGTLYVAGGFDRSNAGWGPNVLSWNGSTWAALPSGYGPNAVSTIVTLAVAPNGDLYAGGVFSRLDGQTIYNLARWNGTAWNALGSSPGGGLTNTSPWRVNTLLVDPNGELYVGGGFPQAGGTLVNNIARWDGNAWSALGSGINGEVAAIARDATGKLYVAGNFGGVGDNSKASSHFAVYDPQAVLGTSSTTTLPTLTLSPNPAHTTVLLTGLPASAQPIKAELRNELGQLVRHCELCSVAGQASLSVAGLPAGTYLLHLPTTAGLTVRRLVVE